jgi:hypothetical protein
MRLLTGALLAGLVGAVAFGLFALARPDGSNSVAEAHEFLTQQIPDHLDVQPGQVIHKKVEVYFRYGTAEVDITRLTGIPTEVRTTESWEEVGAGNVLVRSYAQTTDAAGTVREIARYEAGKYSAVNPVSGAVSRQASYSPPGLDGPRVRAQQFDQALMNGTGRVTARTPALISLEIREPISPNFPNQGSGLGVPYTEDLDQSLNILRVTIASDGSVPIAQLFMRDKSGREVLIQSEKTIVNQVLDRMPAGLF